MNFELRCEVEDFLLREADLLDDRRFDEWLDLLTDDIRYWMPVRHNPQGNGPVESELAAPEENYYFDDTKATLAIRVKRLGLENAWAEQPPSRTRHLITNIRIKDVHGLDLVVHSNFLTYRTRLEQDKDMFVGKREDKIRRVDGTLRLARRTIILDEATLGAKNISIFL
jgi:3-phenylpropionate/cinnamic acid dioxygenase small subunit